MVTVMGRVDNINTDHLVAIVLVHVEGDEMRLEMRELRDRIPADRRLLARLLRVMARQIEARSIELDARSAR